MPVFPRLLLVATTLLSGGCGYAQAAAPQASACPAELPTGSRCYGGQDSAGAFYAMAIPPQWNGVLVVHAHGGPDLGPASAGRVQDDLKRWAVTLQGGYAWVASSYRRGGYGWTMAGEDTERARQLFVQNFGAPRRTLLHGQSYGGGVTAKWLELARERNSVPYDGMLLTNGMLGGGKRYLEFRFDLRVVYQYVCNNHPRADELQYPLWMGLPADSTMTLRQLVARVDECTGVRKPRAQRTPQQQANLDAIVGVVKIREDYLVRHLEQSTWLFRDLTQSLLQGRNPFDNERVHYRGSTDDAALNHGVLRYRADPAAVAMLAADSDPTGKVGIPVISLHAVDDPTAFVELESAYRTVLEHAGNGEWLVQVFSDEHEHSYLSDPEYLAAFNALLDWIDKGRKPTPHTLAQLCKSYGTGTGKRCGFLPDYVPAPLEGRVAPRAP